MTAYLTALPHDAHAVTYSANCNPDSVIQGQSMVCEGLTQNKTFKEGATVSCGCGADYVGSNTYRCARGEAGGYEGYGLYEGYWDYLSTTCQKACIPNATQSCTTTAIAAGTQTCTSERFWGRCVPTACKSGYVLVPGNDGNQCYARCTIANGSGYIKEGSDTGHEQPSSSSHA